MNSRERITAVIAGKPTDVPPFTLTASMYGARLIDCPLSRYYREPMEYLKGQKEIVRLLDPDILITPFALVKEARAFGSNITYFPHNPPNMKKPLCETPNDVKSIAMPSVRHPEIDYFVNCTHLMKQEFGQDKMIAAIMTSPVDLPVLLLGLELWLETLLFHQDIAYAFVAKLKSHFLAFSSLMFAAGVDFVILPTIFTNSLIIDEEMIKEFSLPILQDVFTKMAGPAVLHHGGVTIQKMLPYFTEIPNIIGYVIDAKDDLDECRKIIGPDRLLFGNINGPTLWRLNAEVASIATSRILENRRQDTHFVFATSAADIAYNTPLETLISIKNTVKNWK